MTDYGDFDMPMMIAKNWKEHLAEEFQQEYIAHLKTFLQEEQKAGHEIYPPAEKVFSALQCTPFEEVKVVIMGQDPYHNPGQANGLCFSVAKGVPLPPSLKNIFNELVEDLGVPYPTHGSLMSWAQQGVLLLNATLTVRRGEPLSHYGKGWERFTSSIIRALAKRTSPIVFLLWGKSAQEKCEHILGESGDHHVILKTTHPSPLSAYAGFIGSKPFSRTNAWLAKWGKTPIDWSIL